jgi:hypothetical protein
MGFDLDQYCFAKHAARLEVIEWFNNNSVYWIEAPGTFAKTLQREW